MIRTSSARRGGSDLELLERERAEGRVHRARSRGLGPRPEDRHAARSRLEIERCAGRNRAGRLAPRRVGEAHGRPGWRRAAEGAQLDAEQTDAGRAGHRVAHLPPKLLPAVVVARGGGRGRRRHPAPQYAYQRFHGGAGSREILPHGTEGHVSHGGGIGRPQDGSRLAPVSRGLEPPVQLGQIGGNGRAPSLEVAEFRGGQGAGQPPRGRLHGRRLARRVATQRVEPPRERDHGPGALLELRSRQTELVPRELGEPGSSGQKLWIAGDGRERRARLAPHRNPAPLVRDGHRGREPPEPAAPDEQSRARQEHEHRGHAQPAPQEQHGHERHHPEHPEGQIQGARGQHEAQERHDRDRPHADGVSSPRRRRTTVAPHPPRVGGASANPATPGASARRRRMIAR